FFTVGVYLSSERRSQGLPLFQTPDATILGALALRFGVTPAVLGLVSLSGIAVPAAFLLQAAMPSGINGLIVGHAYGLDQRLIATVIVWGTLAAILVATVAYAV
ncbi:MAG: AEC family transporter, partial [Solirubrobacterales bacterium]|nr:AEC family transporter [Solirubrobacterales bacterium]